MGRKIFVTATDTGAGKTFITSGLIRLLLDQGVSASAIKPVASGTGPSCINEDVDALLQAQCIADPEQINLYTFSQPDSPHIAAAAEGRRIEPDKLVSWCDEQAEKVDICLIEGVGGLMVPLDERYLVSDWVAEMKDCEVMLVVGARLGCINHALLTLEQLGRLNMPPGQIVINTSGDDVSAEHAKTSLQPFMPSQALLTMIPYKARAMHFQPLVSHLLARV